MRAHGHFAHNVEKVIFVLRRNTGYKSCKEQFLLFLVPKDNDQMNSACTPKEGSIPSADRLRLRKTFREPSSVQSMESVAQSSILLQCARYFPVLPHQ